MRRDDRDRPSWRAGLELAVLAALAFIPLLLTKPGMVSADTKAYLYLDPGSLLDQALSMWDPSTAAGTVTHQQIGYLLPQGPFYWVFAHLGVPTWVAQRLWFGSLLFLAGAGIRYATRTLGLDGFGPLVAGVVYELSPYSMQYIERISAILMPWTALGWLLGFTVLSLRRGGLKYPALFALTVALAGGTNATSLIYVGIAPVAWVLYTLFVTREATLRRVLVSTLEIAVASLLVSLWWIAGLQVESAYGLDVLKYTETVPAIAGPATASEVMRGLGYWYFYGSDRLGPWLSSAVEYTQRIGLIVVSFVLPVLGVLAATLTRWKARAYFAFVGLVGLVLSVGTHPYTGPSFLGGALKEFMTRTTAGFALRSTDRATPLVVMSLAVFLGAGLSALGNSLASRRRPLRYGAVVPAGICLALAVVNAGPLMTGLAVDPHFDRPSTLPSYFQAAAKYLDGQGDSTRVLIEPGDDFADYTWGNTIDPVWPGILTRPSIQRQQLPDGGPGTVDLLSAFDLTLQQGTYEPSTLAPIARLLSAGDVVLESDDKFWHYNTPAPRSTWALFDPAPTGIGKPIDFGAPVPNEAPAAYSLLDEQALATPANAAWPPPVAVFPVSDARPIYRAEPASAPLVLDGSGAGVVAAAAAGMLADNPTIFYAGTLDGHPTLEREAVPAGAALVLTDSNAKVLRRWSSVNDNIGEVLPAAPGPTVADPTAQPLQVFDTTASSSETIATYGGAHYVSASSYGNPVAFTPEDRPFMAFDGNLETAWTTSAFSDADDQWIQVGLDHPVTTDEIDLVQPYLEQPNRWITKVTLSFDGGHRMTTTLGAASRRQGGQIVSFPARTFSTLRVTIDDTTGDNNSLGNFGGASGVGFAEVGIPGVNISETLQLPSDLLSALGSSSLSHRLTVILDRERVSPFPPRTDPEPVMSRSFALPTARSFSIGGTARISALIPDNEIDDILGGPDVFGGAVLGSNRRLNGDLNARAVFAFDDNPATWWGPGFDAAAQVGAWTQANLTHAVSFDHLDLQVLDDNEHSVPTELRITTNEGGNVLVHLPAVKNHDRPGAVADMPISFPRLSGSVIRFTVEAVRQVRTTDWYSEKPIVLPFAIASIGLPGVRFTPENPKAQIPRVCRDNLMSIDGKPVWLAVTGTVGAAEDGSGLQISGCGPDAHGIVLGPGTHTVQTVSGQTTGLDLDRLLFDSAPGGGAEPLLSDGALRPVAGTLAGGGVASLGTPGVRLLSSTATSARLAVTGASRPFWLVLGESQNAGWRAHIAGGASLGTSTLIDAYANGWYVDPPGTSFVVELTWTPQREVDVALVVSAAAIAACLVLAVVPGWRVRRRWRRWRAGGGRPLLSGDDHEPLPGSETHRRGRTSVVLAPRLRGGGGSRRRLAPVDGPPPGPFKGGWQATLGAPWLAGGRPAGLLAALVAGLVAGGVAAVVVPPGWPLLVGLGIGLATIAVARFGGTRTVLTLAAVTAAVLAGAITVAGQMTHHYPTGDNWPEMFSGTDIAAFTAFLVLAADSLAEVLREGAPGGGPERAPHRRQRRHRLVSGNPVQAASLPGEELEGTEGGGLP